MGSILSRALFWETLRTFGAAFVAFSFIFQVAALYELLNHGASGRQVVIVAPYVIIYTLPFLLPVALLVGASLAYGRLAADNEVVPVTSGGLPPTVLAWPALFLGLILTCALYAVSGSLIPYGWLKKKDMTRDFIEDLVNMGESENKPVTSGDAYSFFFRRTHGDGSLEGIEIVYAPQGANDPLLVDGADGVGSNGRPVEIVAQRGTIGTDAIADALRFELWDVTLTQFDAPRAASGSARPSRALRGLDDLPPRGAPNQASVGHLVVTIPMMRKMRDRNEYRSTAYLRTLLERLDRFARYAGSDEARARAAADRVIELAPALALPGAGPGPTALALAGTAAAAPARDAPQAAAESARMVTGYLTSRRALSTGPLLFTLVGALVPLRLQHNNRLFPFIVALSLVAVTFFLPYLTARDMVEARGGLPPAAYWLGPAATALAAALLWLDIRRR